MTDDEKRIAILLGEVWNLFLTLPVEHADDTAEFRHGIHALQQMVMARSGRRELNVNPIDPSKWRGWTERGQEWLAAGCPPIEQEFST